MNPDPASNPSSPIAFFRKVYTALRLVSLDVVAGAVGSGIMVSLLSGYKITSYFLLILGIAVWLIYTLDHLLDARRLGPTASTPRHRFHHHYFKVISLVWLLLAGLGGVLVFWKMEMNAIWFGLTMGGITLVHLCLVKLVGDRTSPFLIKEMGVALVYAGGVWGLPLLATDSWFDPFFVASFCQFLLIALINLLLFSYFELDTDEQDKQTSFVRAIGKEPTRKFIGLLLFLLPVSEILIWLIVPEWDHLFKVGYIYLLMWAILGSLWSFPDWFLKHERYRSWGDGAFLIPFLSLQWLC